MTKEELRAKYRALRLAMDIREVEKNSLDICRHLYQELDWQIMRQVCSYKPQAGLKEVNIIPLIDKVKHKYPDIQISFIGASPKAKIPNTKFDLILVPALAYDEQNYRMGRGGGWYDKFLAIQPQALKIGVCFANGFMGGGLPRESHDIPLDKIITEVQ
jgi:5-formyltetrahydrofolate cyclo-ligase